MAFEIDVVVIFSDQDNQPNGWVDSFRKYFNTVLSYLSSDQLNVVLKSEFDTVTSPSLNNVGVLVSILSSDFTKSAHCREYLQKFDMATRDTAAQVTRMFKVYKSPVAVHDQPAELRDFFGYDLFNLDLDAGEAKAFTHYFSEDAERQYWMEMVDLCYDIHNTLQFLKQGKSLKDVRNLFSHKPVYLAQTGYDLTVQRNIIHRELQRLGYTVLPSRSLPGELRDFERAVKEDLAQAGVSIHLIGADAGQVPNGTDKSAQELQNLLAMERGVSAKERNEEFPRFIWITNQLAQAGERQKKFIEGLRRDVETSEGAEIIQSQLEDFKAIIREELFDTFENHSDDDSGGESVYVLYDKLDSTLVEPLLDMIALSGLKVLHPDFDRDLLSLRQQHIDNLRKFDAAIVFQGTMNDQWVRMKVLDLLKAPGFGRKKRISAKAVVCSDETLPDGGRFGDERLTLISGKPLSPQAIATFLNQLKE
ncbi:MAG TPA: hypothetical protein VK658_00420 [Chryseolinea sp.]|nr:hypothetical protein [Chryseolinea sp.]